MNSSEHIMRGEPSHSVDDLECPKVSDYHAPRERSHCSLAESSTKAKIRNFSRPLDTPRAPLEYLQPPALSVTRQLRLVGSSIYYQGGFVFLAVGDVSTTSNQLPNVNGGRLERKQKNETLWQKGDDDSWGKERSCSRCGLM